jgi:hypothetical protein
VRFLNYILAVIVISAYAQTEEKHYSAAPALVGLAGAVALSQYRGHFCEGYPCAHISHIATGAAIGYFGSKYYSPEIAFSAGLAFALAKEYIDKQSGKGFGRTDVLTRAGGTVLCIWIYKEF